jgi:hypothetical protein
MSKLRVAVATGFAASALLLIPAASASAQEPRVTPLDCTPAPVNSSGKAGGNVTTDGRATALCNPHRHLRF